MRVGIDGACWTNRRGYGRFLRELLAAVAEIDRENQYTIFFDRAVPGDFALGGNFRPVVAGTAAEVGETAHAEGRRPLADLWKMSRAVAGERLDLFFFPSVYSYFPLLRPVRMVLGVHDTIADRNPQFAFAARRQEFFWRAKVRLALAQADTVLTVSEYSKRAIARDLRVAEARIRVIPEGAASCFRRREESPASEPYLLYAGGISPNKNLPTLIRAFARLPQSRCGLKLVLVGDYSSDGFKSCYGELRELVAWLGLESAVSFPGFIPDADLCRLYNGARAFVMPSYDEGFGLPALEAMTCGAPVIASRGHALEEVVGDAGLLVDANDEAGLAAAIERVLSDPELAGELSRRSLDRAAAFSWHKAAARLLAIFSEFR